MAKSKLKKSDLKQAYSFQFNVLPKNRKKAVKLFEENKELFERVMWSRTAIRII